VVRSLRSFIPTAILFLDCGMLPRNARISAGNYSALTKYASGPDVVGIHVNQVRFWIWIGG
jgi:hypothetical protein